MLSPLCALLYPDVRVIQMASITVSCETWQTCETCGKGGTRSLRRSCSGQDVLFGPPCATRWKLRAFPHTARNFLKTSSWRQQRYKSRNHHLTKKLHGFALSFSPCRGSLLSLSLLYTIRTRPQPIGTSFEHLKVSQMFKISSTSNAIQYVVT